ncbi:MAG: hypothetical protein K2X74_06345, partial [Acetobacteraceae bacterium]|nr:hypothetical protein [Acetobacteraceae bacterium]
FRDPWGRDSQGRGTTPADPVAVAEREPHVQRRAADRVHDLRDAYRDPDEAGRRLHALIGREGGDLRRAAAVLDQEGPEIRNRRPDLTLRNALLMMPCRFTACGGGGVGDRGGGGRGRS